MFPIDRVQIIEGKVWITEFILIKDFEKNKNICFNDLKSFINNLSIIDKEKCMFLLKLKNQVVNIIFYDSYKINFLLIQKNLRLQELIYNIYNFEEMSNWLRKYNNFNRLEKSNSKQLGSAKQSNADNYLNEILKKVYNDYSLYDDGGIEVTKELLKGDVTRAVDFDLFQYIKSTNSCVIYELLKRENQYISNMEAHPMRYSWRNNRKDNRQKYISLWEYAKIFKAKLYLINYSDDLNEKVSILEVIDLDKNLGIRAERKYCMSYNTFIGWLKDMQLYNEKDTQYLKDFKYKEYDSKYFDNFINNKKSYGKDFYKENIKEKEAIQDAKYMELKHNS